MFTKISISDAGKYRCEASNWCGNASETTTIHVKGELQIMIINTFVAWLTQLVRRLH